MVEAKSGEVKMEKIKAIRPQIIVTGTVDKPYYEILYYDTSDNVWHIGYSSYILANVIKWKEECFEVVGELEDMQPTADVVEVVRCKDCDVPHNKWTGCPHLNGLIPPPDFYCAKGTPKERGGEK